MPNYITEYYEKITSGEIVAGEWIKTWYEMVVAGIRSGKYVFSAAKANKVIRFIQELCHHSKGRNDLITLELWQKAMVSVCFGILDHNGNRQFREVVVIIGRKNGKTLIAACIGDYMLFADGEYGVEIYNLAPKLDQAKMVYDAAYQIIQNEPELEELAKARRSDIYVADTNSFMKPIAFNARKSDGFNPHFVTNDEIASWKGDAGLKQYEVMKSALGARRQPMILSISTAGYEVDGIYDELMKRATRVLKGESGETRLAPFLYIIDDPSKWNDLGELRKSMPNLGVSVTEDYMREEIAVAEGSASKRVEFLTKYCNIRQNSSVAWLSSAVIESAECEDLTLEMFRGCYCVGGIDLSKTTDLTSCCIIIERGGLLYIISRFFMPTERLEAATEEDKVPYPLYVEKGLLTLCGKNHVDYHECYNWFVELVTKYNIYPLKIGYDRYSAQYLVDDMKNYGFHMDDVYQGFNLTPVIREFEGVMGDKIVRIGQNQLLKIHLYNSAVKMDTSQNRLMLEKLGSRTRIDGTAAVLDAMTVRQKWYGEIGGQLKNLSA